MIFDIKRYKYKFKNEIQIFIYKVFKSMSLQKRLNNYIIKYYKYHEIEPFKYF